MKTYSIPNMISFEVGNEMQALVNSYNDMASVLAYNQKAKEKAQQELIDAQRSLNEELEYKVDSRTKELQKLNHFLEKQSQTDDLTGLFNRRYFFEKAAVSMTSQKASNRPCCIMIFDVDDFKSINDNHGHFVGDEILKDIASRIREVLSSKDVLARMGGEEFVLLAPDNSLEAGLELAERIRKSVECEYAQYSLVSTISIGISQVGLTESLDSAIHRADSALYVAKRNGKNRVEFSSSVGQSTNF